MKTIKNKRITAIIAAIALMISCTAVMGGCNFMQTFIMTINGENVNSGIVIYHQYLAFNESHRVYREENPDVDMDAEDFKFDYETITISGKPLFDWVNDRAVELTARVFVVENMFDKRGLEFEAEVRSFMNNEIAMEWERDINYEQAVNAAQQYGDWAFDLVTFGVTWEELLYPAGVSFESFRFARVSGYKEAMLFHSFYGEDGTEPVPEDEWRAYFEENNVRFRMISTELEATEGEDMDEDDIEFAQRFNKAAKEYLQTLMNRYNTVENATFTDISRLFNEVMKECPDCEEPYLTCECEPTDDDDATPTDDDDATPTDDDDATPTDDDDAAPTDDDAAPTDDDATPTDDESIPTDIAAEVIEQTENLQDRFADIPEEVNDFYGELLVRISEMPFGVMEFFEDETAVGIVVRLETLGNKERNESHNKPKTIVDLRAKGFETMLEEYTNELVNNAVVIDERVLAKHDPRRFLPEETESDDSE